MLNPQLISFERSIIVTSSGSHQSPINDAQTGQPKKGVGAKECVQNVLYPLLEDGDRLFKEDRLYYNSWIYQQDGAAAHTSKETKETLNAVFKANGSLTGQQNLQTSAGPRTHGLGQKTSYITNAAV